MPRLKTIAALGVLAQAIAEGTAHVWLCLDRTVATVLGKGDA